MPSPLTEGPDLGSELRAQIFADPDDDGPRLVYADWLAEQGDPRGAFIVDQVRVAGSAETTPGWSSWWARSERTLLERGPEWERPLREAYAREGRPRPLELVWRRGFVEGVELDLRSLAPLEPLRALTPLQTVALAITRRLSPQDLLPIVQVQPAGLALRVPPRGVDRVGLSLASPVLGLLRSLHLPSLRALELSGPSVFPEGAAALARWLSPCPLRELTLVDAGLDDVGLDRLLDAPSLHGLGHLGLIGHRCGIGALERLGELQGLTSLSLGGMPQADLYAAALVLQQRPLQALCVRGMGERPELDWLFEAPHLAGVRRLSLPACFSSTTARLRRLAETPFRGLGHLDLSWAQFGPGELRALLGSPHLQDLVSLSLRGARVGDDGVAVLIAEGPHGLTSLDLCKTGLTDAGAQALAGWPGLARVTRLLLDGNEQLRADGLRALMRSPYLAPTHLHCAVPALQRKGPKSRPLYEELKERFGPALRTPG